MICDKLPIMLKLEERNLTSTFKLKEDPQLKVNGQRN